MKRLAQAIVVFASLLAGPDVAAQAGTVTTPAFSIDYAGPATPLGAGIPDLLLHTDANGATSFTLPRFEWFQSESPARDDYRLSLHFIAQPGFQLLRYELTGQISLTRRAEQPPATVEVYSILPARAQNSAIIEFGPPSYFTDLHATLDIRNVVGTSASPYQNFLDMHLVSNTFSQAGWYSVAFPGDVHVPLAATATVEFSKLRLTVYTAPAPVPEPRMWALLLLGVAPLPWVLRRTPRRRISS